MRCLTLQRMVSIMANDHYQDLDYDEQDEEEASLIFTIMDFEQLVDRYGVDEVMNNMKCNTVAKISSWIENAYKCRCEGSRDIHCCIP